MGKTKIEWTEQTWNPIVGCSIVSPGCTNCYAMKMAARIEAMGNQPRYAGTTRKVKGNAIWTGKLAQAPDSALLAPLRRKKPTVYFVNSMGDLFHEDCPDEWIDRVFIVMAEAKRHKFQVLTKRAARMRAYITEIRDRRPLMAGAFPWPLPNVWLGVSTERQQEADERIPDLLQTPAAVRFISAEPLLGPVDLMHLGGVTMNLNAFTGDARHLLGMRGKTLGGLDWVIVGGESGPDARPMSIQWARELRDQCAGAGVAFFFKQWGEWHPAGSRRSEDPGRFAFGDYEHDRAIMHQVDGYPRQFTKFGARSTLERVGKAKAGCLLDGIEHKAMPASQRAANATP